MYKRPEPVGKTNLISTRYLMHLRERDMRESCKPTFFRMREIFWEVRESLIVANISCCRPVYLPYSCNKKINIYHHELVDISGNSQNKVVKNNIGLQYIETFARYLDCSHTGNDVIVVTEYFIMFITCNKRAQ